MKKVILLVLSIIMLVSLVAPVSAEEQSATISEEEAKALVDAAAESRCILQEYYENHMSYVQGKWAQGEYIEHKELNVPIPNSDNTKLYITLIDHLLPGGSYENFITGSYSIFIKEVAERYCDKYYGNNNIEQFITEDGVRYIAAHAVQATISFSYSPENSRVEIINSSKDSATAKVFCEKIIGYDKYPMWIECRFIRTENGWRISESAFADMMCSFHEYDYSLVSSPSTGDSAGERVAVIGAVSLACIIPTACLMRRRRRASVIF